jgi:hypothetical protein
MTSTKAPTMKPSAKATKNTKTAKTAKRN